MFLFCYKNRNCIGKTRRSPENMNFYHQKLIINQVNKINEQFIQFKTSKSTESFPHFRELVKKICSLKHSVSGASLRGTHFIKYLLNPIKSVKSH